MTNDPYDYTAEAITAHWGERCPDYEPQCACCAACAQYDALKNGAKNAYRKASAACDKIAGDWRMYSAQHRRGAGQCAASIRALALNGSSPK